MIERKACNYPLKNIPFSTEGPSRMHLSLSIFFICKGFKVLPGSVKVDLPWGKIFANWAAATI